MSGISPTYLPKPIRQNLPRFVISPYDNTIINPTTSSLNNYGNKISIDPEERRKIIGLWKILGRCQKYDRKESTIRTFLEQWKAGGEGEVAEKLVKSGRETILSARDKRTCPSC